MKQKLSPPSSILILLSGVQYEVHIQYQPDVKAKLDIAHFQHNWFSGWSVPNIWPSKKLSEKYLRLYEIIAQPSILSFTLHLPESMCSVHPVFHMSMLKPAMSNSFSERTQLAPVSVIIDREPEYEILWIVDSKINCQWVCKPLYKMIWLGYKDTGDELEQISATELIYAVNLVSDFHITYPAKPSSLLLS